MESVVEARFEEKKVKQLIGQTLKDALMGKRYNSNETTQLTKQIATTIKQKLKDLKLPRYKFLVQVVIGEVMGAGVRMGAKCFWDADTDRSAQDTFINDSLFCVAVAFGIYLY